MRDADLLLKVEILDSTGKVLEERTATTDRKLLEAAHADKLRSVTTEVVLAPSRDSGDMVIVRATVTTQRGTFTGIGDAAPTNVPEKLRSALPRIAETRSLCRAFRAALNVGYASVEELAETVRFPSKRDAASAPASSPPEERPLGASLPQRSRGRDERPSEASQNDRRAMSDDQRRFVFRLCFDLGATKENVRDRALEALGAQRLEHATRVDASRAIENLKREIGARGSRPQNGAVPHGGS